MRIGILTYHRAINYGAFLQACSLCERLNQEDDMEAEIIDFRMLKEKKEYSLTSHSVKKTVARIRSNSMIHRYTMIRAFERGRWNPLYHVSREQCISDSLAGFQDFVRNKYDVIIAGSDEIWKVNNFRGFPNPYWLIGDLGCRKFSYAASARVDFKSVLSSVNYARLQEAIDNFEFIGVRDRKTKEEIEKLTEKEVHLCCDPSFLVDLHETPYDLSRIKELDSSKKTILVMVDEASKANDIWRQLHKNYNLLSVYQKQKSYINVPDLSPFEWLGLIKSCDYVVASFFHAICYSILSNTPFLALGTSKFG